MVLEFWIYLLIYLKMFSNFYYIISNIIRIIERNLGIHLVISGSKDFMSPENKYGGLLTKAEAELQRLSRVFPA